jgi:hypothetical protein
MPYPQRYHNRTHREWGPHAKAELAIVLEVVVVVIVTILIFLLVFHDVPLRLGEPS